MIDDDELFESESFEGPEIVIKVRNRNPGSAPGRKKSSDRVFGPAAGKRAQGDIELMKARQSRTARFRSKPGFPDYRRSGTPDGMTKDKANKKREVAIVKAGKMLEEIKKTDQYMDIVESFGNGGLEQHKQAILDLALLKMLTLMNSGSMEYEFKSAKTIMDALLARPSSKSEVTIKSVHEMFANMVEDKSGDE